MPRPFRDRLSRALTIGAAVLSAATSAGAQAPAVLDEGTLMVFRGGNPVGRESYRIVRAPGPGGQVFQASGTTALGTRRIEVPQLGVDSSGRPLSYEARVFAANTREATVSGRGRPGRFSVLVRTRSGESAREYLLDNGALLIDDDVFHQYFFLGLAATDGAPREFSVIAPRSQEQVRLTFEQRGTETIDVGGRRMEGRRLALVGPNGAREVWVDGKGRLLRVSIAYKGLVAVRDDPPASQN